MLKQLWGAVLTLLAISRLPLSSQSSTQSPPQVREQSPYSQTLCDLERATHSDMANLANANPPTTGSLPTIYKPLDKARYEVRILTLFAGLEGSCVECRLENVALVDAGKYVALSYRVYHRV